MVKWLKEKDVLLRLIAIIFAILMWMFVIDEENPDYSKRYRKIPLQIEGMEHLSRENLTIIDGGDISVTATLTGKRDRMQLVSSDKLIAVVDVSSITEPGVYTVNYSVRVDVQDVTVTSKSPQQITIEVARFTSASIPVSVELTGSLGSNLASNGYTVTPNAITVRGPEDIVNTIASAKIKYSLDDVTASVDTKLKYDLLDKNGSVVTSNLLSVDTPSVSLNIPLTMTKQVPVTISYYSSDLISEDLIRATMSVDSLILKGDPDVLRDINQIQVGSVSLRNMVESGIREYSFFYVLPNGVSTAEGGSAVQVTAQIDIPGYSTKQITVNQTKFASKSDFTYLDQNVTFHVFGPTDELDWLTAEDFTYTPSYSASNLKPGQQTIMMRISSNNAGIHVLGSYVVKVKVPSK